jgi:hypothetical protein
MLILMFAGIIGVVVGCGVGTVGVYQATIADSEQ